MNITEPLRLATGSHAAGSGKGCGMNVISWENGDTQITDFPACSDRLLSTIVQQVNDELCTHRDKDLLCPSCSGLVLDLAHRTVGTGEALGLSPLDRRRVWVWVAADQARQVLHLTRPQDHAAAEATIVAAEAWAVEPTFTHAAASAAAAAYVASAASYAAAAAASAAYVAHASYAASAASAASAAHGLQLAHRAVDVFQQHTSHTDTPLAAEAVESAVARMLQHTGSPNGASAS